MTLQKVFIVNLKKFRKLRGISQMTLAELCDMSGNYIGQIEMGRRIPSFEKIEKIAGVLDIESYKLFIPAGGGQEEFKGSRAGEWLKKMPPPVKKEIIARLVSSLQNSIFTSLDSKNY